MQVTIINNDLPSYLIQRILPEIILLKRSEHY